MRSFNPFDVDFFKLAAWLTPKPLRKVNYGLIVKACISPLIHIHNTLLRYREAKLYQLTITPQVCFLERMLNDRFDYSQRRIYIMDADWHLPIFLFQENELKPVSVFKENESKPTPLYTEGESGSALNDFVVMVPLAISFSEAEMRSLIDSYKLFGTLYTIQTF